jgi:hypothetical protein
MATDRKSKNVMKQPAPSKSAYPTVRMTKKDNDEIDRTKVGVSAGNVPKLELRTIQHGKDTKTITTNIGDVNRSTAPPNRAPESRPGESLSDALGRQNMGWSKGNK